MTQLSLFPYEKVEGLTESFIKGGNQIIHVIKVNKTVYSVFEVTDGVLSWKNSVTGGKEILQELFDITISI